MPSLNHSQPDGKTDSEQQHSLQQDPETFETQNQQRDTTYLIQRAQLDLASLTASDVLQLQSLIGNYAVARLLNKSDLSQMQGKPSISQSDRPMVGIQRKIIIGGNDYTPNPLFLTQLENDFGSHMREFVERMDNGGSPPNYSFSSFGQLKTEVRIRHHAIKGMELVHAGCCGYPHGAGYNLDSTFWEKRGTGTFVPKSPLPTGKEASDAIEAIFAPNADTRLECFRMATAIQYYSLLKGLGKDKFNSMFPGGAGLEISTRIGDIPALYGSERKYKIVSVSDKSKLLPGDWVYFKNFPDYLAKHPGGAWQGENAIYMGDGKFSGFGAEDLEEDQMNKELVKAYNVGLPLSEKKTTADLVAIGRGLRKSPVLRPIMSKIAP